MASAAIVMSAWFSAPVWAAVPEVRQAMPALYEAGHFYVTPQLPTGQTLRLLVDTGGAGGEGLWVIRPAAVRRLGWQSKSCSSEGQSLQVIDLPAVKALLPLAPPPTLCAAAALVVNLDLDAYPADGVLGAGYMSTQTWTFDYPQQQLWREPGTWRPAAEAHALAMQLPHDAQGRVAGLPGIHVTIDGEDLPMLLDTGATAQPSAAGRQASGIATVRGYGVTSYISTRVMTRWHARHPDWAMVENGDDLMAHTRLIRVPQLQIAGWQLGPVWFTERSNANMDALGAYMSAPVQGSAGANIFQRFVLSLDYRTGTAWLVCGHACRAVKAGSPGQG